MFRLHIAGLIRRRAEAAVCCPIRIAPAQASAPGGPASGDAVADRDRCWRPVPPGSRGKRPGRCRSRRPNRSSRWRFRAAAPPRGSRSCEGQAAAGVDHKRLTDGARWAGVEAGAAGSAVGRRVRPQEVHVRERCPISSQDPQSRLIRLLCLPIQPRPASSARPLSKRRAVDACAPSGLWLLFLEPTS